MSTPEAARATETQTPQPVVFISKSRSFEVVTGEKLQQYETSLSESLGMGTVNIRRSTITYAGGYPSDEG
jgi:hypothetical protein